VLKEVGSTELDEVLQRMEASSTFERSDGLLRLLRLLVENAATGPAAPLMPKRTCQEPQRAGVEGWVGGGGLHRCEDEEPHADGDSSNAEDQQRVGRTDDFDDKAIGVVPPIVERR
jgi:hypothetical protein